jgi:hypothetical protein
MPIRIATGADAEQVTAIYAPYVEQSAVSFESVVPSIEEMAARISDRQPAYPWLVAEDGDRRVVGYAYAWHDVGWWQRSLGATDAEPQPPRPYTDLPVTTLHGALATGAVELS